MNMKKLIAAKRAAIAANLEQRAPHKKIIDDLVATLDRENREMTTSAETQRVVDARAAIAPIDAARATLTSELEELEEQLRADEAADAQARELHPTAAGRRHGRAAGDDGSDASWVRTDRSDRASAVVGRQERFVDQALVADHAAANQLRDQAMVGQHGSLGQMVRAMSTSAGSAIIPTVWAGDIIDRARNTAAVLRAGAEIVPMDAKTVQIGRLTGDPTAGFRSEGSTITASDPTFDNVTLDAKTMSTLVVGSLEWFQDASNVDEIVTNAIARAFALQLDLVALYGSITTGAGTVNLPTPPNPRGVLGALNALASTSVLGGAANGTAQTASSFYNELLDLVYTPQDFNETPNGLIWNSKAARQYAKGYDTTGQPLRAPDAISSLPQYVSNQLPSYTQGTMAGRATDVFAGDWKQLLIGQRLDFTIQTLTEKYAETGQVGIVAHWRGDVGLARPRAFAAYRGLQGAS